MTLTALTGRWETHAGNRLGAGQAPDPGFRVEAYGWS